MILGVSATSNCKAVVGDAVGGERSSLGFFGFQTVGENGIILFSYCKQKSYFFHGFEEVIFLSIAHATSVPCSRYLNRCWLTF